LNFETRDFGFENVDDVALRLCSLRGGDVPAQLFERDVYQGGAEEVFDLGT
jgi:hypothetical protein